MWTSVGVLDVEEAPSLADGDVEATRTAQAAPAGPDAAATPVPHGALRGADEVAELLEVIRPRSSQSWGMWIGCMVGLRCVGVCPLTDTNGESGALGDQ